MSMLRYPASIASRHARRISSVIDSASAAYFFALNW